MIETYASKFYFLLDRRYHYPPDEIDGQVISQEFIGNELTYDNDPMAADPDFLVIGQFGNLLKNLRPGPGPRRFSNGKIHPVL